MADVALLVMVATTTHRVARDDDPDKIDKERRRCRPGDVISVYPMSRIIAPSSMEVRANGTGPGRMRWLRVTGIPSTVERVRELLTEPWEFGNVSASGEKKWKLDIAEMLTRLPAKRTEMMTTGWTTVTWAQAKLFCRRTDGALAGDRDIEPEGGR